jgi:hypothetical protein
MIRSAEYDAECTKICSTTVGLRATQLRADPLGLAIQWFLTNHQCSRTPGQRELFAWLHSQGMQHQNISTRDGEPPGSSPLLSSPDAEKIRGKVSIPYLGTYNKPWKGCLGKVALALTVQPCGLKSAQNRPIPGCFSSLFFFCMVYYGVEFFCVVSTSWP